MKKLNAVLVALMMISLPAWGERNDLTLAQAVQEAGAAVDSNMGSWYLTIENVVCGFDPVSSDLSCTFDDFSDNGYGRKLTATGETAQEIFDGLLEITGGGEWEYGTRGTHTLEFRSVGCQGPQLIDIEVGEYATCWGQEN